MAEQSNQQPDIPFEKAIARLEEIVRKLETADAQLSESLDLFEEGVRLSAHCNRLLDTAEQRVTMLVQGESGMERVPMNNEGNGVNGKHEQGASGAV